MGIDGINILFIRGNEHLLDELELLGLSIKGINNECDEIADRFFGNNIISIRRITDQQLKVSYNFRNMPVYQYLEKLLQKYPTCWFKNTFYTEDGLCGLWIGRFNNNNINIQTLEWRELTNEEQCFVTDFSK